MVSGKKQGILVSRYYSVVWDGENPGVLGTESTLTPCTGSFPGIRAWWVSRDFLCP